MPLSLRDGELKRKDLYVTSDAPFTAYLMLRGYELLGTVDEGEVQPNGKPRLFFGLMPTDELILSAMHALARVEADINDKYDEFENRYWISPMDAEDKINVRQYYLNTRACFRALDEAIRRPKK